MFRLVDYLERSSLCEATQENGRRLRSWGWRRWRRTVGDNQLNVRAHHLNRTGEDYAISLNSQPFASGESQGKSAALRSAVAIQAGSFFRNVFQDNTPDLRRQFLGRQHTIDDRSCKSSMRDAVSQWIAHKDARSGAAHAYTRFFTGTAYRIAIAIAELLF